MCRQADLSKLPYQDTGHPISQPSVLTHVDFTETSGPNILERYFGEDAAAELKKKPWAIIQVRTLVSICCLIREVARVLSFDVHWMTLPRSFHQLHFLHKMRCDMCVTSILICRFGGLWLGLFKTLHWALSMQLLSHQMIFCL